MQWTKLGANNCTGKGGKSPHLFGSPAYIFKASHIFDDPLGWEKNESFYYLRIFNEPH